MPRSTDVPVERGLELAPVIGLDRLDLEGQLLEEVVDELDGRLLVQAVIGAKDSGRHFGILALQGGDGPRP
jgi:hypothetical protein